MKARTIAICLILFLSFGSNQALAATPKAGTSCTKVGLKSGSLICAKVSGTLKWQILKKAQTISYSAPKEASATETSIPVIYASSSKLAVSFKNLTPNICSVGKNEVRPTGTPGLCLLKLSQTGNSIYLPAKELTVRITLYGANEIDFLIPGTLLVSQGTYALNATSTSGLPVTFLSNTQDICSVSDLTLTLLKAGTCVVVASQPGGGFFPEAKAVIQSVLVSLVAPSIIFEMPSALLLSQSPYLLTVRSSSTAPITFLSQTVDVCTVSNSSLTLLKAGTCQVVATQSKSDIYSAASVTASVEVSAARILTDLPDQVSGFQIKAIYVVPSDGVDNSYDTDGRIASFLTDGTNFLKQELGLTLPIDSSTNGYDITFLKSSKPTSYFLNNSDSNNVLLQEIKFLEQPSPNRKDFVFFIDVPYVEKTNVCGFATTHGISAVVAIGTGLCTQKTATVASFASTAWVHEVFHNFGVNHVPDSCDLMASNDPVDGPLCASDAVLTIDRGNKYYVKSSSYGQDLLTLRVWDGHTADQGLIANCWEGSPVPRADGLSYAYCPTGTRAIGALRFCWKNITSLSLEESINGVWQSLGSANHYSDLFGGDLNGRKCIDLGYTAPWKTVTVDTPGIRHYRWIVNGQVSEEMNIIWVR